MIFKKLLRIILVGLVFLLKPIEIAHGCEPHPVRNFMSGSHFAIGEVIAIDETEILIDVADYFMLEHITNEELEVLMMTSETFSFPSSTRRVQYFEQGDYVIASLGVAGGCYFENDEEIFHVTTLDYATLQVEDRMGQGWMPERMLTVTEFVNHGFQQRNSRTYRQHHQTPMGWLAAYNTTSLILGQITAFERDEVTIEIWDYVIPDEIELTNDRLTLYQERHHLFIGFNVGDDVAVTLRVPTGDGDTRTLVSTDHSSMDIFSVNVLEDGSVQLESDRIRTGSEDSSLSALYTDLLQHRGNYPYVVTFGGTGRYKSVARLVDDELIMIYQQEEVLEELVDGVEFLIGAVLGVIVVVLVTKNREKRARVNR